MARPLPVNLLLAGTGGVLLVSGISGQSLAQVLKGDFGKLKTNPKAGSTGNMEPASFQQGTGSEGEPTVFSSSTFAPSPTVFSKHMATPKEINRKTAELLFEAGVEHPTNQQIDEARKLVEQGR